MLGKNKYYVVGDKKTFKTKKEFITEIFAVYEIKANKKDIDECWMRYSPLVENEYVDGGSYVLTEADKRGAFECWEYQYN